MVSRDELEQILDRLMEEEAVKFLMTVPGAAHLTDESQPLDEPYYIRHRIETIKRIRLTAKIDALALARMIEEDYGAAREWSRYAAQELNHDLLYLADLRHHGYSDEQISAMEPLEATREMVKYLEEGVERVGAIAAVAYSVFVEWNSARYSRKAVAKAQVHFSPDSVKGSSAHVSIDDDLDHYGIMVNIAHRLLLFHRDEAVLLSLIRRIASHFRDYFSELHATARTPAMIS
jgi:hypothetical protein